MIDLLIPDLTLPIVNPVLKFLIILMIILFAPLLLNRVKIPHILGLIIAGAIIGPNGFNLVLRDSSIILSGTAGLLYIMFLAGLEIDFNEFVHNSKKSIVFGMLTFCIPMGLGILAGIYLLKLSLITSVLLASMFASHTLIAYPIIAKLGIKRNRAVTVAIGGTMITDTLALLVLAVIVGMSQGEVGAYFWIKLSLSVFVFGMVVLLLFPIIARAFFKTCSDGLSQYIFVLVMVFLGASLAELAGIEAIIGAFLAGLSLNRLIPHSSALMNRIEFVGNAIFIPFFLIGVGMLIDYRVFLSDWTTIYTAIVMTVVATVAKYIAAYLTQKSLGYTSDERSIIFGLSNAQAAATLAAVLVGYNVILGHTAAGEPIRLLSDSILNGTIVMIFVTCTIASFSAQKGALGLSMSEKIDFRKKEDDNDRILIPLNNPDNTEELIAFAHLMTMDKKREIVSIANIVDNERDQDEQVRNAKKVFERATHYASAADRMVNTYLRYDANFSNGIINLIREHEISDLVLGVDHNKYLKASTLGRIIEDTLDNSSVTTYIYRSVQPIQTVKRHILVLSPFAEQELGFRFWFIRIWSMLKTTGATVSVYANETTLKVIQGIIDAVPVPIETHPIARYKDLLIVAKELKKDDGLIFVMSKKHNPSYDPNMEYIPHYINTYFQESNFILIYPFQQSSKTGEMDDLMNPSSASAVARIEDLVDMIGRIIKTKGS